MNPVRISVIGAGSWGTTLADLLAKAGRDVTLWSYEESVAKELKETRTNESFLSGIRISESLQVTTELSEALTGCDVVLWVTPAQVSSALLERAAPYIPSSAILVNASKGIEVSSLRRMDEIFGAVLPEDQMKMFSVLSGPSFAREVALGQPTAVVAASREHETAAVIQDLFQTEKFRVYTNTDVVGVELSGALKNVIALAAGVVSGLGFGHNTAAALITRGLTEMSRLGSALGADPATFAGLAGMGDLVLTCTGGLSRNRTVGVRLGQGESLDDILLDMKEVAEGVMTTHAVRKLAEREGVEMPICEEVYGIIANGVDPREAARRLMTRDPKAEIFG